MHSSPIATRECIVGRCAGAAAGCAALLLLAVPLAMLLPFARVTRVARVGRFGRTFRMWMLDARSERPHRLWTRFGVAYWPALLNVARGELGWVGPRALACADEAPDGCRAEREAARPGLMCLWSLRRRTLIDYGDEWQADLEYLRTRGARRDLGIVLRHLLVALMTGGAAEGGAERDVTIVDVRFDNLTMDDAIEWIGDYLDGDGPAAQVCFVNPACVNIAARHRGYRAILRRSALVLPDGIGIKIAGEMLATPLRQNVNGTDLFPRLCTALEGTGHGIFLLGGKPGIADAMAERIRERFPGVTIAGCRHGYFDANDDADMRDVIARIRASGASLLLVAMGVPLQEQFIARHLDAFGVKVALGVGGLFDFMSGATPRAPAWLREIGGEWLFRLAIEPGRMWKRYLVGNATFLARVAQQHLGWRRRIVCRLVSAADFAAPGTPRPSERRCVLFATRPAPAEFPVPYGTPNALVPIGATSALEQVLQNLAAAGCVHVDLVVSDTPDRVRALVGDGERWGLAVRLHLSGSTSHPYDILRQMADSADGAAFVIGHAESVPDPAGLARLFDAPALLVDAAGSGAGDWSGWASASATLLDADCAAFDRAALHAALRAHVAGARHVRAAILRADTLDGWRAAQYRRLDAVAHGDLPLAYRPRGWGGDGAHCRIAPDAVIHGPVLIGERCMIGSGVEIGPNVVIGDDVIVGSGTTLRDATVLSGTYVGPDLDLADAIVGQSSLYSWRWRAHLALCAGDALIAPLDGPPAKTGAHAAARVAAGLLVAALAPVVALHGLLVLVRIATPGWTRSTAVVGWDATSGAWIERPVRTVRHGHRAFCRALLSGFANALDIASGVRCWTGPRPRSAEEMAMLPRDWQVILGARPPGWWHMPVVDECVQSGGANASTPPIEQLRHEINAAADVYGVVTRGRFAWIRMLLTRARTGWA